MNDDKWGWIAFMFFFGCIFGCIALMIVFG